MESVHRWLVEMMPILMRVSLGVPSRIGIDVQNVHQVIALCKKSNRHVAQPWAAAGALNGILRHVRQNRTFSSDFSAKVTGVIFRLVGASDPWTLCPYAIEPSRPVLPTLSR